MRPLDAGSVTLPDTGAVVLSTAMPLRRRIHLLPPRTRPSGGRSLPLEYAGYLYVLLK